MGKKRIFSKLLLFAAMISTIGAGIFGSVPLPVKAAEEEETYKVRFEAYEGTCETENVSVPKGESIILPDAVYEGHYLESWVEVIENGNVHTFKVINQLDAEERMIIYGIYFENKTQVQLAKIMGVSRQVLAYKLNTILNKMRRMYQENIF